MKQLTIVIVTSLFFLCCTQQKAFKTYDDKRFDRLFKGKVKSLTINTRYLASDSCNASPPFDLAVGQLKYNWLNDASYIACHYSGSQMYDSSFISTDRNGLTEHETHFDSYGKEKKPWIDLTYIRTDTIILRIQNNRDLKNTFIRTKSTYNHLGYKVIEEIDSPDSTKIILQYKYELDQNGDIKVSSKFRDGQLDEKIEYEYDSRGYIKSVAYFCGDRRDKVEDYVYEFY